MTVEQSAKTLQSFMLDNHIRREDFSIGMGDGVLHIYCRFPKSHWRGTLLEAWETFPVKWHFGIGRARAFAAA